MKDISVNENILWDLKALRRVDQKQFKAIESEEVSLDPADFTTASDLFGIFDSSSNKDDAIARLDSELEEVFGELLGDQDVEMVTALGESQTPILDCLDSDCIAQMPGYSMFYHFFNPLLVSFGIDYMFSPFCRI